MEVFYFPVSINNPYTYIVGIILPQGKIQKLQISPSMSSHNVLFEEEDTHFVLHLREVKGHQYCDHILVNYANIFKRNPIFFIPMLFVQTETFNHLTEHTSV